MKMTAQSENVTAADLNPRALQLARFNARINGMERIEFVQGDLFTPFQGRCFDLIVANPPFFLLPANEILYRDNPLELDIFVEKIVRQAPQFLNEGGFFQMIFEWVEIEGQPWREQLAEWVSGSGCDVWLIKDYSQRPTEYSHTKMQTVDQVSVEQDVATMAAWTEHYRRHNVVAMHGGIMAMRKRSGVNNWVEMEEYSIDAKSEFGELVEAVFDGHDFVEKSDDEAMLGAPPALVASSTAGTGSARQRRRLGGAVDRAQAGSGLEHHVRPGPPGRNIPFRLYREAESGRMDRAQRAQGRLQRGGDAGRLYQSGAMADPAGVPAARLTFGWNRQSCLF